MGKKKIRKSENVEEQKKETKKLENMRKQNKAARKAAKANQKGEKIRFISSMKAKILILVIMAVTLTGSITLLAVVPSVRSTLRNQTSNYMYDMAVSHGTVLEDLEENGDYNNSVVLSKAFSYVGLQGVKSSYAYVVDGDGTVKCHPKKDLVGQQVQEKKIQDVVQDIKMGKRSETAVVRVTEKGKVKYLAYYVTENQPAILVISADEDEIMAPVQRIVVICIVVFVANILIFAVLAMLLTSIMVRPLGQISNVIGRMAHMDFVNRGGEDKLMKRKDETGLMSRAVVSLREEMHKMVSEIQAQSDSLFTASEQLDHDASNTAKTLAQVGNAVGDIASGATSQADETQSATEHVITMGNMIEETNQVAEVLEQNSRQMQNSSDQAMRILQELMEVNERTKLSIEEIANQTNITNGSAQKIKEATNIIASIAEETNLLSLNASIEAARAGEQGRGFAVVASQIQKLAEQSNDSASQIDDITNVLIQDSGRAVETMQEVQGIMELQSEKMMKTDAMFKQVMDGVEHALSEVIHINDRTENLDDSRNRVVDVVQNLSAIAQENAASSEETSASVIEVSNILENISGNATKLKDIAYQMDQSVKKIQI